MKKFEDGIYITSPMHGPRTHTRKIVIEKGSVVEIEGKRDFPGTFSQSFFFDVNVMIEKIES